MIGRIVFGNGCSVETEGSRGSGCHRGTGATSGRPLSRIEKRWRKRWRSFSEDDSGAGRPVSTTGALQGAEIARRWRVGKQDRFR